MAYVAANAGEKLLIKIGDGAGSEVFTHPVLINLERSLEMSAEPVATQIPQTGASASLPAKTVRVVTAVDWQASGAGILNNGDDKTYADWLLSGVAKNVKAYNDITGALVLTGSAILTSFQITGTRHGKTTCQLTIMGADLPVASAAS